MISDVIALAVFGVVFALVCAITALLVRSGKSKLATIITAGLGLGAAIGMLIAYTSDDDYLALFALVMGELAGLFAIAALIGLGLGVILRRKRG